MQSMSAMPTMRLMLSILLLVGAPAALGMDTLLLTGDQKGIKGNTEAFEKVLKKLGSVQQLDVEFFFEQPLDKCYDLIVYNGHSSMCDAGTPHLTGIRGETFSSSELVKDSGSKTYSALFMEYLKNCLTHTQLVILSACNAGGLVAPKLDEWSKECDATDSSTRILFAQPGTVAYSAKGGGDALHLLKELVKMQSPDVSGKTTFSTDDTITAVKSGGRAFKKKNRMQLTLGKWMSKEKWKGYICRQVIDADKFIEKTTQ